MKTRLGTALWLFCLTIASVLITGFHPAAEDDGVYLAAIYHQLNPRLFRPDADFFAIKLKATVFDTVMASAIRLTHLPPIAMEFVAHLLVVFAILTACYRIVSRCFQHEYARWCGVALVGALFSMPVTATGLFIVDEYLVPRAIVTALTLFEIDAVLERRYLRASILALIAILFHPVVAAVGISLCIFLAVPWPLLDRRAPTPAALAIPIGFLFDRRPLSPALRSAIEMHDYFVLSGWAWYEWLGVFAPTLLLLWFAYLARRKAEGSGAATIQHLATRTAVYSVFQLGVALVIMLPPALERMRPLEPMRYLYLLYVLMILLGGGFVGEYLLQRHLWRWLVLFVPLVAGMFWYQRSMFPSTPHLELPGMHSSNPWMEAFDWIRKNTPEDAYFALGPDYMDRPGEDVHGFRALTLRSALAENRKDSGMVVTSETLAERWQKEVTAQNAGHADWQHVSTDDLRRLKAEFGVTWTLLQRPAPAALDCPYQNEQLAVCRI